MSDNIEIKEEKSFLTSDPRIKYCAAHSLKLHPAQLKMQVLNLLREPVNLTFQKHYTILIFESQEETIAKEPDHVMLGAPEVLKLCSDLIHLIGAKRILDVGQCFTYSIIIFITIIINTVQPLYNWIAEQT